MKKVVLAVMLLLPMFANATWLLDAYEPMCLEGTSEDCLDGSELYFDSEGRCNCFFESDFFDLDTCKSAMIMCEEPTYFDTLYQYRDMCGMIQPMAAGCGCFELLDV